MQGLNSWVHAANLSADASGERRKSHAGATVWTSLNALRGSVVFLLVLGEGADAERHVMLNHSTDW